MKISKLYQVVIRTLSISIGLVLGVYYTVKSIVASTGESKLWVPIIGITIFLIVGSIIKDHNKGNSNA